MPVAAPALEPGMRLKKALKKVLLSRVHHPITVEPTPSRVIVRFAGRVIADTEKALTLREAKNPPVQYIPLEDVAPDVLEPTDKTSYCPFKGDATYYRLRVGERVTPAEVWSYVAPPERVAAIKGHVALSPDRIDSIEVHYAA
jgi:uncharacterized protein (DUF427 family)